MAGTEDVTKLAKLSRLAIPEDQLEARAAEFDRVIAYIAQLDELALDTAGTPEAPRVRNVFREDGEPTASGTWTEKLVDAFPEKSGKYLSVKKIISHD